MITLNGEYNSCNVYTDKIDTRTKDQLQDIVNLESFKDCKIAVMPNARFNENTIDGLVIRHPSTIAFPGLISKDAFCGITVAYIRPRVNLDLDRLDWFISTHIPYGNNAVRDIPLQCSELLEVRKESNHSTFNIRSDDLSIGTLGGGNHFIQIGKTANNEYYLIVHTGSREFGSRISRYWNEIASKNSKDKNIPYNLSRLEDPDLIQGYYEDLDKAELFSAINSYAIMDMIRSEMRFIVMKTIESFHNYTSYPTPNTCVLRRNAIFMGYKSSNPVIITLNHCEGILLVHSTNEIDSHFSHEVREMNMSFPSNIDFDNSDGSLEGFKNTEAFKAIKPFISSMKVVRPIYTFKAGNFKVKTITK